MAITSNDIVFKLPKSVSDAASNGGRISNNNVSSLLPNINGVERASGLTRYRKAFFKNEERNPSTDEVDLTLYNAKVYMEAVSPGEDYYRLAPESIVDDVQSEADDITDWYGVGFLDADITGPATDFDVVAEDATGFIESGLVCVASKATDGTVTREIVTLNSCTWNGNTASLSTSGVTGTFERAYDTKAATIYTASSIGSSLASYTVDEHYGRLVRIYKTADGSLPQVRRIASNTVNTVVPTFAFSPTPDGTYSYEILKTYVSQVVDLGDLVASSSDWVETSSSGTYDESNYPVVLYPVGAVNQTWTIHFTSATAYNVSGNELGTVVTGQLINANCAPTNGTSYYFTLNADGFGGTWASGDEIVFKTYGSYAGFWVKQVVPSNCETCGDNTWTIRRMGDSA